TRTCARSTPARRGLVRPDDRAQTGPGEVQPRRDRGQAPVSRPEAETPAEAQGVRCSTWLGPAAYPRATNPTTATEGARRPSASPARVRIKPPRLGIPPGLRGGPCSAGRFERRGPRAGPGRLAGGVLAEPDGAAGRGGDAQADPAPHHL